MNIFRMNMKINEHLFWTAINETAPVMLRASAEIMGCFALLFYLLATVYYKDSVDVLFAGIYLIPGVDAKYSPKACTMYKEDKYYYDILGIALLAVFKAIESLPHYFHIKNINRPRQKSLLRITQFIKVYNE